MPESRLEKIRPYKSVFQCHDVSQDSKQNLELSWKISDDLDLDRNYDFTQLKENEVDAQHLETKYNYPAGVLPPEKIICQYTIRKIQPPINIWGKDHSWANDADLVYMVEQMHKILSKNFQVLVPAVGDIINQHLVTIRVWKIDQEFLEPVMIMQQAISES
jgi:hypothetical protein